MAEFIDRLKTELMELSDRRAKLEKFIFENPRFGDLSNEMRDLMRSQRGYMCDYERVLVERLGILKSDAEKIS